MIFNNRESHQLVQANWHNGILSLGIPTEEEPDSNLEAGLVRLTDIVRIVKNALETNPKDENCRKVARKCWDYAIQVPDPKLALLACEICHANLPESVEANEESKQKPFSLVVGEEKIELPGYYKALLAKESTYFEALFTDEFKEKRSGIFTLANVNLAHFKILLNLFRGENLPPDLELDHLVELLIAADRFDLKSIAPELMQVLAETISNLNQTPVHRQILADIYARLTQTSFYGHPQLQTAIDEYFRKATTNLKIM